jgi:hypothetical protein
MARGKTLFVSDFDDTLARTDAMVYVIRNGERVALTPGEYATYEEQPGDQFDFSEFDQLKNPQPIKRFVRLMQNATTNPRIDKVAVLTARNHTKPVAEFLRSIGITGGVSIAALGDANPQRKANYIEKHINAGFNRVGFVDDSEKNVVAVRRLADKYPNATILAHQVKEEPAEEKVAKRQQQSKQQPQQSKRAVIKQLLRSKVTNPKTGEKIFVQTALRNKEHPAHRQAVGMVNAYAKKHNIRIKSR